MELQGLLKMLHASFCLLLVLLLTAPQVSSEANLTFITQPPESIPCNPYPMMATNTRPSSLKTECTLSVPASQASNTSVVWRRRVQGRAEEELMDTGRESSIRISTSVIVVVSSLGSVGIRSILELRNLQNDNPEFVGEYYCVVISGQTTITSVAVELMNSSSYSSQPFCELGSVIIQISVPGPTSTSAATSAISSTLSAATSVTSSAATTAVSTPNEPPETLDSISFQLEEVIIMGAVGGVLIILLALLVAVLIVTCCCARRHDKRPPLMTSRELTLRTASTTQLLQDVSTEMMYQPPLPVPHSELPPTLNQTVKTLSGNTIAPINTRNNSSLNFPTINGGEKVYESLSQSTKNDVSEYETANGLLKNTSPTGVQTSSSNTNWPVYNEPILPNSKLPNSKSLPTISKFGVCVSKPPLKLESSSLVSVVSTVPTAADHSQLIPELSDSTSPLKYRPKKPNVPPPVSNKAKTTCCKQTGERVSIDGEYVYPNVPVAGKLDPIEGSGGAKTAGGSNKLTSSTHYQDLRRDNREYLALYMKPTGQSRSTSLTSILN